MTDSSKIKGDKEIEITPEMIEAGASALLGELGGAVSSHWFPRDLAAKVFSAMVAANGHSESHLNRQHNQPRQKRQRGTT